MEAATLSYYVV